MFTPRRNISLRLQCAYVVTSTIEVTIHVSNTAENLAPRSETRSHLSTAVHGVPIYIGATSHLTLLTHQAIHLGGDI